MKKIFFAYSDDTEDIDLYKELKQHFTPYARHGLLSIIDKDEMFRTGGNREKVNELLRNSDAGFARKRRTGTKIYPSRGRLYRNCKRNPAGC